MKGQRIFPSVILIGFGLFFFLQQTNINWPWSIFTWPTMFIIVGIAFLIQAYGGKTYESILPGIIFFGLGIHFHLVNNLQYSFDHVGIIILFIALGFFLYYQKTKNGLLYGWLFLILAVFQLFYQKLFSMLGNLETTLADLSSIWPIILIVIGVYLFFFKRK